MSASTPFSTPAPQSMTCAAVEAALAAHVLDALEPHERRDIEAHLAGCAGCRAALARHEAALAALAEAVPPVPPPARLKQQLLAEIARTPQEPEPLAAPAPIVPAQWRWRRTAAALAAVAALLLVALGLGAVRLHQVQTQRDNALSDHREIAEYLGHGGVMTALTPVSGEAGGASGSLIVAPDQPRALLIVTGLPAASSGEYRAWAERAGQRTWLAPLEVAADGTGYLLTSAPMPLASYDRVGIALQRPGESPVDLFVAAISSGAPASPSSAQVPLA